MSRGFSDDNRTSRTHTAPDHLNPARIERFLRDRLRRLDADTWQQLADKIGRLAYWEFEDYTAATS